MFKLNRIDVNFWCAEVYLAVCFGIAIGTDELIGFVVLAPGFIVQTCLIYDHRARLVSVLGKLQNRLHANDPEKFTSLVKATDVSSWRDSIAKSDAYAEAIRIVEDL